VETTLFDLPYVRWADSVLVQPGGHGAWHRRLYDHEFVYVLEGQGHIVLEGRAHFAGTDSLFLVQPRVWHSYLADAGVPWRLLGVHFDWRRRRDTERFAHFFPASDPEDPTLFRETREVPYWELRERPFLDLRGRGRVRRTLETLCAEHGRGDAEASGIAGALLAAAVGQMAREARLLEELNAHASVGPDAVRRVQRARDLLEAPHDAPLSIEAAAATVGWSGDHMRRMFKQVLGSSPAQIQTSARLRRAQELLRYGGLPIAEVAKRCAFEDASHFARVFRRATGQTPREWAFTNRAPR